MSQYHSKSNIIIPRYRKNIFISRKWTLLDSKIVRHHHDKDMMKRHYQNSFTGPFIYLKIYFLAGDALVYEQYIWRHEQICKWM